MMTRLRQKGDIELIQLQGAFAGDEIAVRHLGPEMLMTFRQERRLLKYEEARRLISLREGIPRELAPELWPESIQALTFVTDEGVAAERRWTKDALSRLLVPKESLLFGREPDSAESLAEELLRLALGQSVLAIACQKQELDREESLPEGTGVPHGERPALAEPVP